MWSAVALLPLYLARPWSRLFLGDRHACPLKWKQASIKQSESKLSHSKE